MEKTQDLLKRFWPLLLLFLAIFVSSSTVISSRQWVQMVAQFWPGGMTEESFGAFWRQWWWLFVKGWHATEFGLLFLVARHCLKPKPEWLAALIAASLAAGDEIHQLWVPSRGGLVSDWVIDCLGILFAWRVSAKAAGLRQAGQVRWIWLEGLWLILLVPAIWWLAMKRF